MSSPLLIPQSPCLSIHDFFQKSYAVPDFQRGYAWKEEQVKQLLEDVHEFLESGNPVYLLGQVIVSYGSTSEDYILVDGQQRVTTLLLLLIALHKRFMQIPHMNVNAGLQFTASRLAGLIMREVRGSSADGLRAKVTVAAEGVALVEAYIHSREQPDINGWTRENIKEAYDTINAYLDDEWPNVVDIPELYQKVVDRIFMVRLELPNTEMAVDIFEKINNRGLGLSSADLIKNVIFQKVSNDAFLDSVSTDWDTANATLYLCKTGRIRSIEYLLRAMMFALRGELVTNRDIRDKWRMELKTESDSIKFARSLPIEASHLRALDQGKTPRGEDTRVTQGSRYFGAVQNYPILLAGAHLSKEGFEILGRFVDDRIIMSLLAKERPQEYERLVPPWCLAVRMLPPNATYEEIREASSVAHGEYQRLIALFRLNVASLRTRRSTDKKRIRYILARVSRRVQLDASVAAVPELSAMLFASAATRGQAKLGYDIEHINPMSVYGKFESTDSIGNLVLAHPVDQRVAGGSDPIDKMEVYRTSNLILTQSLCGLEDLVVTPSQRMIIKRIHETAPSRLSQWNDEAIEHRENLYCDLFIQDLAYSSSQN
jgi:hypothetical protein